MDEKLRKEVEKLISQGYYESQIKQLMTQKGYTIPQIDEVIKSPSRPVKEKKRNYKRILAVSIISIIIIGFSLLIFVNPSPRIIKYTDNPKDWVVSEKNGSKIVDVNLVSKGRSFIDDQGQQYRTPQLNTMFYSYGYYQGAYFEKEYDLNGNKVMSISTSMNPSDGVIEGYAVFDIVNDSPVFYIFVDEDWKQKVNPTIIFYGFEHTKNKTFEFNEVSKGIYMDKIVDDKENYNQNYSMHLGSILVGDITQEKIDSKSNDLTMFVIK